MFNTDLIGLGLVIIINYFFQKGHIMQNKQQHLIQFYKLL